MKILIVDDSLDKVTAISEAILSNRDSNVIIDCTEDIVTTLQSLTSIKYDLVVLDLLLPWRKGEDPIENGGATLVKEIQRNSNKIVTPSYIIGLTQYDPEKVFFSDIWKAIKYSKGNTSWSTSLNEVISHVVKSKKTPNSLVNKLPTIFVEGKTDKEILIEAIKIHEPKILQFADIDAKGNGANWVSKQICIWALQQQKEVGSENLLIGIGLLDSDNAGRSAKSEIERLVKTENGKNTYKIIQYKARHNLDLLPFFSNGLNIDIEIESLFTIDVLQKANDLGYMEDRTTIFETMPKDWNQMNTLLPDFLCTKGIKKDSHIYLKKIKEESKNKFCKMLSSMSDNEKKEAFSNFDTLISEICDKLKIN